MRTLIGVLAAVAVLAAACGTGHPTTTANRTATAQTGFPSPLPTSAPTPCAGPSNPCLAVVTRRGSDNELVSNVTDIALPQTLGALAPYLRPRLVSASEIAYIEACDVFTAPLVGFNRTRALAATSGTCVVAFAWSPDAQSLAYLAVTDHQTTEVHILREGKDALVATVAHRPALSLCSTQECADSSDFQFVWSPDGGVLMWNQSITSTFRIWTAGGVDVTPSLEDPSMAVWSGSSLYFQDSKGIEVFRSGAVSSFLPGVKWIKPSASPTGGEIVYESGDASGPAHVYVVETANASVNELGAGKSKAAFLTSRFVWYKGERPAGKTYIYDLQDGIQTESVITSVTDVWPHAA